MKNHHYVPKFYLKNWANAELTNKVVEYSYKDGEIRSYPKGPGEIACEKNLYKKRGVPKNEMLEIEKGYGEIENKCGPILKKIIQEGVGTLTLQQKKEWAQFVTSLLTRHPYTKKLAYEEALAMAKRDVPYGSDKLHGVIANNLAIETQFAFSSQSKVGGTDLVDKYINLLSSLHWWVLDFKETNINLLTSDYPLQLLSFLQFSKCSTVFRHAIHSNPTSPIDLLITGEFLVCLPLSPKICFYAHKDINKNKINEQALIKFQNKHMVLRNARKSVYDKNYDQEKFIIQYMIRNTHICC